MDTPTPLKNIDWAPLLRQAKEHVEEAKKGQVDDDSAHYIYETVMTTIYGRDFWKWYNSSVK